MYSHVQLNDLFDGPVQPKLFLDFDGTISQIDVIDAILEKFADSRWRETEDEWLNGNIGSRECLEKQFSYVRATQGDLFQFVDTLNIDEGFRSVLKFCRKANLSLHIISDGFEEYIRRMLGRYISDPFEMKRITISANSLVSVNKDRWDTLFPYFEKACTDGCATCKPAVMRSHNPFSATTVFVGDGLSDGFAARTADIVFAKSKLADYCRKNSIPHIDYRGLAQVAETLEVARKSIAMRIPDHSISWSEAV